MFKASWSGKSLFLVYAKAGVSNCRDHKNKTLYKSWYMLWVSGLPDVVLLGLQKFNSARLFSLLNTSIN